MSALGTLRRRLPAPIKRAGVAVLGLIDPLLLALLRRRGRIAGPVPPRHLRARVGEPGPLAYLQSGRRVAEEVEEALAGAGRPIDGFTSVWDFGAGSGRVLTRLSREPGQSLASSDVDEQACRWLAANHGIDARPSSSRPPAPFGPDSFDLVIAISVFTHLSEDDQDLWLAEVGRLLRPGGLALLSVMGVELLDAYRLGRRPGMVAAQQGLLARADLTREGIVFAPEPKGRWSAWRYPGTAPSYGLTFHDHGYVRERWGRFLEVQRIVPRALNWGQDAVLCGPRTDPG